MITSVKLPSGHLGLYPEIKYDTELKGEHHEMLLSAPEQLFERTMASVVGSLMQTGDSLKLTLPDLMYLFFLTRSASISSTYRCKWICKHTIKQGGVEQECGTTNDYSLNLASLKQKFVSDSFEYPRHEVAVSIDIDGAPVTVKTKAYVRFLTVAEEFDALDTLTDMGISRDQLRNNKEAYIYSKIRVVKGLMFEDQRLNALTEEQKAEILKNSFSFTAAQQLFDDLKELTGYGTDLSPKEVTCSKCKAKSKFTIPMSGSFFLA